MAGKLITFYGCMFAGKTTALLNHIQNSDYKLSEILILKPSLDFRAGLDFIKTHDGKSIACNSIERDSNIDELITPFTKLIAIDEAQFFDKIFYADLKRFLAKGIDIAAAGLDKDYLARPFGLMPLLMQMAADNHELFAKCNVCGTLANYTYRKADNKVLVLIGAENYYEARCETCYHL